MIQIEYQHCFKNGVFSGQNTNYNAQGCRKLDVEQKCKQCFRNKI